jgi:hypothetical protein
MFKPFFSNLTNPLPTRFGGSIGKAIERVMLGKAEMVGKRFRQNPDGSTTMLKMNSGMPRFTRSGGGSVSITVSDASDYSWMFPVYITHTVTVSKSGTFNVTISDKTMAIPFGVINNSRLSDGVTLTGTPLSESWRVKVPSGVVSFNMTLEALEFSTASIAENYRLNVSKGSSSGYGTGSIGPGG